MSKRGENIYKRKDGRWEGRIKRQGECGGRGGYKSIYGKTYKEIKQKMEEYRKNPPKKSRGKLLMGDISERWLDENKSVWKPTTYGAYSQIVNKYIRPALGKLDIASIDARMLDEFSKGLGGNEEGRLSNNYRFYICALTIRILRYAGKRYDCEIQIPDLPVAKNKKNKIIPPSDVVLSVLENYVMKNRREDTCLGIAIALYTGIRIGELCALSWEDINLEERMIYIKRNIQRTKDDICPENKTKVIVLTPKTADSERMIPIPPTLYEMLSEQGKGKAGAVIAGVRGPWIDTRTLQYRFKKILEECGIEYFNFHMLRHAFATRCVAMGFDIKSLSEILGHSSIQMTMSLYVHPSIQQKKQLMDKFHSYRNPEAS